MWVHSRLNALHQFHDDWTLTQCLFGEHLLALYPDKPVALVESEKSAVICAAVLLDYLCGRTRGKRQFCDKINVLRGRKVIACPNVEAYGTSDSPPRHRRLSSVEKNATEDERKRKIDLADRIIEERLSDCQRNFDSCVEWLMRQLMGLR